MPSEHAVEWIGNVRQAESRLRAIARNRGRTMATTQARRRHERIRDHFTEALIRDGHRDLVGDLVEEADLAWRLSVNLSGDRPELRARLKSVRARIRKTIADLTRAATSGYS